MIDKFEKNGEVAVLISPGFGAGWSTWGNKDDKEFLTFDSGLVKLAENKAKWEEVNNYLISKGFIDVYAGGWHDIEVKWLPKNHKFYIHEFDGSESIIDSDHLVMTA